MKTTERLLRAAKDIWAAYSEHPFVLGIQNGTLEQEKFRYYIIQDFLYLEQYAKVFALGIAKAKRPETIQLFSKYVTLLTIGPSYSINDLMSGSANERYHENIQIKVTANIESPDA